ncbi:MAG: hypothetical protein QOE45_2641 [Frankiaceae bacterium]|jgi:hypothetical protein|nr:hypothetical protein [Frankiaceae bacterium]
MVRRNRNLWVTIPERALMHLVEWTGAAARGAGDLHTAMGVVLRDVAAERGYVAGHAWVPAGPSDSWQSSGLWVGPDETRLHALRNACAGTSAGPVGGHLALALERQATQWVGDLDALRGSAVHSAASAAGIVGAVACPVFAGGEAVALLEWYVATPARPVADLPHALGHLSGVLSEVAERPGLVAC